MVQSIGLERNLKLLEIEKENSSNFPDFKENVNNINDCDKWRSVNEEFLNSLVEMLK